MIKTIMKITNPVIKIVFIICFSSFLYFFYRDLNVPESVKGYHMAQAYFFIFLSVLVFALNFLNKSIQLYFNIIFFSFIFSLFMLEGYFFYTSKTKLVIPDKEQLANTNASLQMEIKKKGGYIWNFVEKDDLMSFSGISNSKIIFCNEDNFYSTYTSDRYGLNNPDYVWDEQKLDIVLIGDSFVHGACVNEGDDITSNIRRLTNLNAINLGWPRTGPLSQYGSYLEYIEKKPKYLFWVFFGTNDVVDLKRELKNITLAKYISNSNFRQNLKNKRDEINLILKENHNLFMQTNFKLYKINKFKNFINYMKLYKTRQFLLYKISEIININKKSSAQNKEVCTAWVNINTKKNKTLSDYDGEIIQERELDKYIWNNKKCINEGLNEYFNILSKMKKITDKNDTKLVLIYFTRPENGFSKKASSLLEMKEAIFKRMEQNNIDVIDIDNAINENFPIPSVLYPKHHPGYHYNKLGYRFIGEKIVEFINKN